MSVRLYFLAGRVEGDLSGPERLGPITWRDDHEEGWPLPRGRQCGSAWEILRALLGELAL